MLTETIETQGRWLFRWRSYIILVFVPLGLFATHGPEPIKMWLGPEANAAFKSLSVLFAFSGLFLRAWTVGHVPYGSSGRDTKALNAEFLNTTGVYSLVRNPLYLANAITYLGVALYMQSLFFFLVLALFLALFLERIVIVEERFLAAKFGETYAEWTRRVPAFLPSFANWVPPVLPFSFTTVLKREHPSPFALFCVFLFLEIWRAVIVMGDWTYQWHWIVPWLVSGIVYVALRTIKKNTAWLDVYGRG